MNELTQEAVDFIEEETGYTLVTSLDEFVESVLGETNFHDALMVLNRFANSYDKVINWGGGEENVTIAFDGSELYIDEEVENLLNSYDYEGEVWEDA